MWRGKGESLKGKKKKGKREGGGLYEYETSERSLLNQTNMTIFLVLVIFSVFYFAR